MGVVTEVGPGARRLTRGATSPSPLHRHAAAVRRFFMRGRHTPSPCHASASRRCCHISASIDRAQATATPERDAPPCRRGVRGISSRVLQPSLGRTPRTARPARAYARRRQRPNHRLGSLARPSSATLPTASRAELHSGSRRLRLPLTGFDPVGGRVFLSCAPGRIRTFDLRFRRPTLYPAELRAPGAAQYHDTSFVRRFFSENLL